MPDEMEPEIPEWPSTSNHLTEVDDDYIFFDVGSEDYCTNYFEYAIASIPNVNDLTTEGELSAFVPFGDSSWTARGETYPSLPVAAPENVRVLGNPDFSDLDPNNIVLPNPTPPMEIRWDAYKGACRTDFSGFRVYRQQVASLVGYGDPTPLFEMTDEPTLDTGLSVNLHELPHNGAGSLPISTTFRFMVKAVSASGGSSGSSNAACARPVASRGACNPNDTNCDAYKEENSECWPANLAFWLDPNAPPPIAATLKYPMPVGLGNPMDSMRIDGGGIPVNGGVRRIRIYKRTEPGASWNVARSVPGDERVTPVESWALGSGSTDTAAPVTDCGANTSYMATLVDLLGRESPPSNLISPSRGAQVTATWNTSGSVQVNWSVPTACQSVSASYKVYKADIPCTLDPNAVDVKSVTCSPLTGTSCLDPDPTDSMVSDGTSVSGTGAAAPVLLAPGSHIAPGPDALNSTPTFTWQTVNGTNGYGLKIQKKTSDGSWSTVYVTADGGPYLQGSSFALPSGILTDGKKYRWKMRSHKQSSGWGDYTDFFFFVLNVTPDQWVYWVRVLRAGDDPNAPWPPPLAENRACVTINAALYETGTSPEAEWRMAALDSHESEGWVPNSELHDAEWPEELRPVDATLEARVAVGSNGVVDLALAGVDHAGMRLGVVTRSGVAVESSAPVVTTGVGLEALSDLLAQSRATDASAPEAMGEPATPPLATTDAICVDLPRGFTSGPRIVGQMPPTQEVIYFHTDHLGSPVLITDSDGQVVSRHKYLPFGEEMEAAGTNTHSRRFTGHERDTESGLDYMLARYYSAGVGRFSSVDSAGASVHLMNPQTWNRYSYVLNSPLILTDPTGEVWVVHGDQTAQDDLIETMNQNLYGQELKVGPDGKASLASNGLQGPPTQEQAALASTVSQVIENNGTTTTTIVEGASQTAIGSLSRGTIDIADVRKFGGNNPASTGAVLGHELVEQFASQVKKVSDQSAHEWGKRFENAISGWNRGADPRPLERGPRGATGTLTLTYTRGSASVGVTIIFRGGNVVDVTKN